MDEKLRFDDKVVVITGSGAGLGRAYALLFGSRGAKVVVNDLGSGRHGDGSSKNAADSVVNEIKQLGGVAVANYDSVTDGDKIIETAINSFGRIDILINNAGILRDKSFARMTEQDWDLIQSVHVKGAMKTTKAAWNYFRKQKYGKIILTASNSGLYGNFGQANYSTAKMALVGFANTLAIEGQSSGIRTNVIIPTAGSRLTEDIVPPDFWKELKPELIAPVVMWLCHENCTENGSIIESALGWAGKCHLVRSNGCILRQNIHQDVTPEAARDNWEKVTDMSGAKRFESIAEATGELMNVVETLTSGNPPEQTNQVSIKQSYTQRDVILYALGVGATLKDPFDFKYLYENHEEFSVLPCYYAIYGPIGGMGSDIIQKAIPNKSVNLAAGVHGEQYFKVLKKIPTEAAVETRVSVQAALDKGRNAVVLIKHETFDMKNSEKIFEGQLVAVIKGAGGFGGPKTSEHVIPCIDPPNRKPDASYSQRTSEDQAAIYRLSGDPNPLHIDPDFAPLAGFNQPILHGLSSLGFAVRHVLRTFADGNPELFDSMKVRFTNPVVPGQTLRTDMWRQDKRIHFQTTVVENNTVVIAGAYVDLKEVKIQTPTSKL